MSVGPGPASYYPEKELKNSKSMTKGTWGQAPRKIHKEIELGPGPGEYNAISAFGNKGTKMGKTAKLFQNDLLPQKSPGPGQYDILTEFEEKRKEIERQLTLCHSRMLAKMGQSDVIWEEYSPFMRNQNRSVEGDASPSMSFSLIPCKQKRFTVVFPRSKLK